MNDNTDAPQSPPAIPTPISRRIIHSLKAKADAKRSRLEKFADWMTQTFGSIPFLLVHFAWFVLWILINLGLIPGVKIFDPFPFGLLTMVVSLEAIFLSVIVLISQNRGSKVDDLREEIDLQVDIIAEQELTKLLHMVAKLMEKQGIDISQDAELQQMLKPTDMHTIERSLQHQAEQK